jgi:glycerol-3-phosphate dehydrogenase
MRKEGSAGSVSRKHVVLDHRSDGARGLVTVAGGKLTAWRSISADVADRALGRKDASALDAVGLRGEPLADRRLRGTDEMRSGTLPLSTAERLATIYGSYADEVLAIATEDPWWSEPLVPGKPAIRAEVAHAVRSEWAATTADIILRRLALGFDVSLAMATGAAVADVLHERMGWTVQRCMDDLEDLRRELGEHEVIHAA